MAWYLCDPGQPGETCTTCVSEQSKTPFPTCVVPRDPDALGSCTNCWWSKGSHRCSRRVGQFFVAPIPRTSLTSIETVKTPRKKSYVPFAGFEEQDLRDATDHNLDRWAARIQTELVRREEEKKVKTPRGRKRPVDQRSP